MNCLEIDKDLEIVDFRRGLSDTQKAKIVPVATITSETIAAAGMAFIGYAQNAGVEPRGPLNGPSPCTVYEHSEFNGQFLSYTAMLYLIMR